MLKIKIALEESLFIHYHNNQVWDICMIDTTSKECKLTPTYSRNSNTLKDIVLRYIRPGITIITDESSRHSSISQPNSWFQYIIHNHNYCQYKYDDEFISYIEQLLSPLKVLFKRIYVSITDKYFI